MSPGGWRPRRDRFDSGRGHLQASFVPHRSSWGIATALSRHCYGSAAATDRDNERMEWGRSEGLARADINRVRTRRALGAAACMPSKVARKMSLGKPSKSSGMHPTISTTPPKSARCGPAPLGRFTRVGRPLPPSPVLRVCGAGRDFK